MNGAANRNGVNSNLNGVTKLNEKKGRAKKTEPQSVDEKFIHFVKQHSRGLLALIVGVLLVHDVFGTHGFIAMRRTEREIKKVQADLDHLNKENEDLQQQVQDLKTDPRTIERLAREGSLLARPGEVIIKIPHAQWAETSATTKR
jgi:cell division protein FtsB